jgi:hypothetical protein
LIGVGLSAAAGRWGMIVFFLFFAALQLALIVGRGQQERRAWNRLERAALANGWVRPAEPGLKTVVASMRRSTGQTNTQ